jgi:oxygen-independent coproporphyrinogen-3 oxidase
MGRCDEELYRRFEDYLLRDLKQSLEEIDHRHVIRSVFFGGGTPSLMTPQSIERILDFLFQNFSLQNNVEITLEANPATFDLEKMRNFRHAGVNRLSLGVQSFFDKNLRFLGRIYDGKQALEAAAVTSQIFDNFSFDFIYGHQSLKNLLQDLSMAVNFGCRHVSCYQLTFEEDTPFYRRLQSGDIKQMGESRAIKFHDAIGDFLESFGIFRYEVSNYSTMNYESRHNLTYWEYDDYLGVGPGAHSRISSDGNKKKEMIKISDPFLWEKALESNNTFSLVNTLTEKEKLTEALIMGLRLIKGIKKENLYSKISNIVVDSALSLERLLFLSKNGLITEKIFSKSILQLSEIGLKKMNSVVEMLCSNL